MTFVRAYGHPPTIINRVKQKFFSKKSGFSDYMRTFVLTLNIFLYEKIILPVIR